MIAIARGALTYGVWTRAQPRDGRRPAHDDQKRGLRRGGRQQDDRRIGSPDPEPPTRGGPTGVGAKPASSRALVTPRAIFRQISYFYCVTMIPDRMVVMAKLGNTGSA
jgi:hypothetical protein